MYEINGTMSYAETLRKVVQYLNDTTGQVSTLTDAMTYLQNEGLDLSVIDNVNKKISDGTIGNLINNTLLNSKASQTDLNTTNANVNANTLAITGKADKTYLDQQIGNIGNASPKGTYATVSALQTSFPTGTNGIYVVTADGKWYYWNGTVWTAGGTYQATQLAVGSVTTDKLGDLIGGKNLFNKLSSNSGYYVDRNNGNLVSSTGNTASDYILVNPSVTYTFSPGLTLVTTTFNYVFYDSNKTFISSGQSTIVQSSYQITTPANAKYVRFSINTLVTDGMQFEAGSTSTSFETYYLYNKNLVKPNEGNINSSTQIANGVITLDKMANMTKSKNLFNKLVANLNYYVDRNNGGLVANINNSASDYIPVTPNTTYTLTTGVSLTTTALNIVYYNSSKGFLSGSQITTVQPNYQIVIPSGAYYVRFSINTISLDAMQFEVGNTSTSYEKFYYYNKDIIKPGDGDPAQITSNGQITNGIITLDKMAGMLKSKNLFNKNLITTDYYLDRTSGGLVSQANYVTSDFMLISENTNYVLSPLTTGGNTNICFYDKNKIKIGGSSQSIQFVSGTTDQKLTTPAGASYVRVSVPVGMYGKMQLELGDTPTTYAEFYYYNPAEVRPTATGGVKSSYSREEVVVIKKTDQIDIYIKGGNEYSNRYIHYPIKRSVKALDRTVAQSNYDTWRLNGANEVDRTGDYIFSLVTSVCNNGEWEMAVFETGATDFIGGIAHGDEVSTDVYLLIDGVEKDLTTTENFSCRSVKLVSISDMYRDDIITPDSLVKVGTHYKYYEFTSNGLELTQEIRFLQNMTFDKAYLCMLPIQRLAGTTQITDTAFRDYDYKRYDVSVAGFNNEAVVRRNGVKRAWIYGKTSGISADVEILEASPVFPNNNMQFSNSDSYNKFYFDFCGAGATAVIGDKWKLKTRYRINTHN